MASGEGTSLVGGLEVLQDAIYGTCHEICLRKVDLEYEKTNPSTDLMCLAQRWSRGCSCPPCPPSSYGSGNSGKRI